MRITMSSIVASIVVLLGTMLPVAAVADTYRPFLNFRQTDATGRYYLVVKKNGGPADPGRGTPVTFELAKQKPGSPPVTPAEDSEGADLRSTVANPEVRVRDGDTLLGHGSLERCPSEILISSTGLGFVGLDVRGYNYGSLRSGDALVIVSKEGTILHRKNLIDLFDEKQVAQFLRTAGGVGWCGGGWVDETRRQVVILGSVVGQHMQPIPRLFRVVNLQTGAVQEGSPDLVLTALSEVNPGALEKALELAAELKLAPAKPDLVKILANVELPLGARLEAAVALAALNDRRGGDMMKRIIFEEPSCRYYAILNLPSVIGDESSPVLCEVVRRLGEDWAHTALQAMNGVSSKAAVPELLRLLREEGCPTCIDFAVECLGNQGREARAAVPDLIKLLEGQPRTRKPLWTQQITAMTLGRIGPDAELALPVLTRLAEALAPDEWKVVKDRQPALRNDNIWGKIYSDDWFVDAICKIRQR